MFRSTCGALATVAGKKWVRHLIRRPNRAARRALGLEQLESREVPAAYTWVPTAAGTFDWNDAANWSGGPEGTFPNAADDIANLTGALVGNQVVRLNTDITIGTLNIGSSATAGGYTVVGNGGSLTFDVASGSAAITDTNTGGDSVVAPITLNDDLAISGNGTDPLALGITIAGGTGTITTAGSIALASGLTTDSGVPLAGSGTISASQSVFVVSFYDSALYQFDAATGELLATLAAPNSSTGLVLPAGLTTGPDGNLYISNQLTDEILKYDLATQSITTFVDSTTLNAIAALPENGGNEHFAPADLRFGPDGNLYVSLNGGFGTPAGAVIRLGVTETAGELSYNGTAVTVASGVVQPSGLTFGNGIQSSDLFVSTALGSVVKITGATGATPTLSTFVSPGSGGLEFPSGLQFGPGGQLYVVDLGAFTGAGKILRYNPDGSFDTTFVVPGTGANPGDLAGQFPADLVFDSQGNLLVANLGLNGPTTGHPNDFSGSIYQYTSSGAFAQALVTSADFPQTGPAASFSGIIPSQLTSTAAATLTVGGDVNPGGADTGILTVPDVTFGSGSSFTVELNGTTAGTEYDRLVSTGTIDLNNATLFVAAGFSVPVGTEFTIVSSANPIVGTFDGLAEGATVDAGGQLFTITYVGGPSGNDVVLTRADATAPTITAPTSETFFTGKAVDFTVTATGVPFPTFAVTNGDLPPGLTLDSVTGRITGTPTTPGTYTPEITATNASGDDAVTFTFEVQTGVVSQITSADNATFTVGTADTFTVTTTGNPTPTVSVTGTLPAGVTFDPATGELSGTPAAGTGGTYPLTFTATNGVGLAANQSFTLTVNQTPAITSSSSATFVLDTAGSFQVTATGFPAPRSPRLACCRTA